MAAAIEEALDRYSRECVEGQAAVSITVTRMVLTQETIDAALGLGVTLDAAAGDVRWTGKIDVAERHPLAIYVGGADSFELAIEKIAQVLTELCDGAKADAEALPGECSCEARARQEGT